MSQQSLDGKCKFLLRARWHINAYGLRMRGAREILSIIAINHAFKRFNSRKLALCRWLIGCRGFVPCWTHKPYKAARECDNAVLRVHKLLLCGFMWGTRHWGRFIQCELFYEPHYGCHILNRAIKMLRYARVCCECRAAVCIIMCGACMEHINKTPKCAITVLDATSIVSSLLHTTNRE